MSFLPDRDLGDVVVDVIKFSRSRVLFLPHRQYSVVDPATAAEGLLQQILLLGARVYAIFKSLVHSPRASFWCPMYCFTVSTVETK